MYPVVMRLCQEFVISQNEVMGYGNVCLAVIGSLMDVTRTWQFLMYPVVKSMCQEFVISLTQNMKKTSPKKLRRPNPEIMKLKVIYPKEEDDLTPKMISPKNEDDLTQKWRRSHPKRVQSIKFCHFYYMENSSELNQQSNTTIIFSLTISWNP